MSDGKQGCRTSHLKVAQIAKDLYPQESYLVFEDDCVLSDDWMRCVQEAKGADVVFLGYNDKSWHTIYGTHALMISPKARDLILARTEELAPCVRDVGAFDHILSELMFQERLSVIAPSPLEKERWAHQRRGLRSLITGHLR